ncbi:PRC-barrel domain-containing protein [Maritalea myrionectae]|uniref:PRC-barrel domain-containing protein n=1 Tax=Maritalea myrionectae TaxID=454601 RepID=UPI0004865470|nr:PRC-barrel domain-containing protein [Maritalea myrionectae]
MSKKLLISTALVTLISAPAYADGLKVSADTSLDAGVETSAGESNSGSVDAGVDANVEASIDTDTEANQDNSDTSTDASASGTAELNGNGDNASATAELNAGAMLATDLLGEEIYTSANADVQVVGDVNDVVMDDDGNADWLIVGVGGFLGLGEKEVAIAAEQVAWAQIDNEKLVVTQMTQAELEAADAFDRAEIETSSNYTAQDLSWTAEGEARLNAALQ